MHTFKVGDYVEWKTNVGSLGVGIITGFADRHYNVMVQVPGQAHAWGFSDRELSPISKEDYVRAVFLETIGVNP